MENLSEIINNNINKAIIPKDLSTKTNKIFLKYTNPKYRQYSINIIRTLCNKSPYRNKNALFYQTLLYNDIILYNCGNNVLISNLDLLIFSCFIIAVKCLNEQIQILKLKDLKNIYREKYCLYKNEEILINEISCLKILNYNVNYITSYDYIKLFILNNNYNKVIYEYSKCLLENLYNNDIKYYIYKSQYTIASEILIKTKEKFHTRSISLLISQNQLLFNSPSKNNQNYKNNLNRNLIINSPLKNIIRKEIKIEFSKKKELNNETYNSSNNFFSTKNKNTRNKSQNELDKIYYITTLNNIKERNERKLNNDSSNNIIETNEKKITEDNINKETFTERLGSPVNFVNLNKNSLNIEFKNFSSTKKSNPNKFIIYNPKNRNRKFKKIINIDNNNRNIEIND